MFPYRVLAMHISTEGKLGISVGLIALGGTGAVVLVTGPFLNAVGWACIIIAMAGGIALVCYHLREKGVRLGTILISLGAIFLIFGGAIGLDWRVHDGCGQLYCIVRAVAS
jgi:hypothetical protein